MTKENATISAERPFELRVAGSTEPVRGYLLNGTGPRIAFVHGFRSHCQGEKARALRNHAAAQGYGYIRFDQRGRSAGGFTDFTLSRALADCLGVIDMTDGDVILVGSSLGGLLALEAAQRRPRRVAALLLIAPAVEFVRRHFDTLDLQTREIWRGNGRRRFPDLYEGGFYELDYGFLVDARNYRSGDDPVTMHCPVEIVHGEEDELLPAVDARRLAERLRAPVCRVEIVAGGDHRLTKAIPLICERVDHLRQTVLGPEYSTGAHRGTRK